MIRTFSLINSVVITLFFFLVLAYMNADRINLKAIHSTPTTFYKRYRPKVVVPPKPKAKQPVKQKKTLQKTKRSRSISQDVMEETVVDISELQDDVVVIQKVIPKYPDVARKSGIECKVLLEVVISEKGRVISAKVVYASQEGYGFKKNALKAVKRLRFDPVLQDGAPVKVKVIYPIDFVLIE